MAYKPWFWAVSSILFPVFTPKVTPARISLA